MAVKPQLLNWILCDNVHIDPATGKHFLLGCFSNIRSRKFPLIHPRMIWFLTMTDLKPGKHRLKLSMGLSMENMSSLVEREFESKNPLQKITLINEMRNLKFESAGDYLILIEVNNDPLLVTTFTVSE